MSIARPSQKNVGMFMITQQGKKFTGHWQPYIRYVALFGALTVLFTHTFHRSLSPSGIVPRILYERSMSPFYRSFRHLTPPLIILGTLVSWDVYWGLWSDKK